MYVEYCLYNWSLTICVCVLYTALLCVIVCEACGADVCVSVAEVRSLASDLLSRWMAIFKEGQSGI